MSVDTFKYYVNRMSKISKNLILSNKMLIHSFKCIFDELSGNCLTTQFLDS